MEAHNLMAEREELLKNITSVDFNIVELNLYLDTHTDTIEIKNKLAEYEKKSRLLRNEYETKYGPIIKKSPQDNNWEWI